MAAAAATAPSLLAYSLSPSATFLNQALAFMLWGAMVAASQPARCGRGVTALLAAIAALALAAAVSSAFGALPSGLALSTVFTLAAAALLVAGGAGTRARDDEQEAFAAFCWGLLVAGLANLPIALLQVFVPDLTGGDWVAASGFVGRAVGNLRQPNHLSSLLLWACIAAAALLQLRRIRAPLAALALALLVFAVVLTASRTGLVSVVLLAVWGLADRRLSRATRALLVAAPLVYALAWLGMAQWAAASEHTFGGAQRLAETDISSSRFGIWANTLALIRAQPWLGVGVGEFNIAWTLSPFPGRPVAFFDHTHNLVLQFAVELGLPLAACVLALLLWALARGLRLAWAGSGDAGTAQRCAMAMVLMIGLHSLLEYPLWYSYFLLPAAWAWGYVLQGERAAAAPPPAPAPALGWAGLVLMAGAAFSVNDYLRVAAIFGSSPGGGSLEQRIADGQRSVFFAHHADYAAVTSGVAVADPARAFDRATHYLLDTRLMMAWARALAARGELDAARHIAARLREFRNPDAAEFFAVCDAPASPSAAAASAPTVSEATPFQCQKPQRVLDWRDFLPPR
ncbi:Polymerase [Rubrivivax sp. A210]|nr:Polymerase [Rubrivivax sp. A210]